MISIWGGATARTLRAHWACEELALAYTPHLIGSRTGATQSDEFKRLNPKKKIPIYANTWREKSPERETLSNRALELLDQGNRGIKNNT